MFFFNNNENIELFEKSISDEDVSILVGVNGCGKSTYLNDIAKHHLNKGKPVICIANTIYDKFTLKSYKAKILKSSKGKNIAKQSITQVINLLDSYDSKSFFNLSNVFNYIDFKPIIEFNIHSLNSDYRELILMSNIFNDSEKEDLVISLNNSFELFYEGDTRFVLDFSNNNDYEKYKNRLFLRILKYENKLKKINVLKKIDVTLFKNDNFFLLSNASSGELTLIASLIYISANIQNESVIIIDEPENSLHPKWQIEYVKKLIDLFYFYQPKIIIATHSPLIINGAELNIKNVNIFKGKSFGEFIKQPEDLKNVEEIYDYYFDVTTPENRFISQFVIDKFNLLTELKISYSNFENIINGLINNSYDVQQKNALLGILDLAKNYS
ncbi:AAA family ATPase [Epilithonimonas arachidiradicis]|uniref:Putative AbiEii toxin of type IV toxin-antitoxin system n=1 Tax=Epilithonimonas arachidiradicis TaxID=1617282 RepID=A0A420DAE6_9FLAO|nr:AAA family ATPase [Epilithonimonas arachidiradicis]RKE88153.1 putative AbiEii toxin of type IV toxin-antitoxin system [Epilithonimonas arachidiradicis]GGG50956.1 hypothetical protein GCM10007332_10770 [Epilithonimonas arachidiradicis]